MRAREPSRNAQVNRRDAPRNRRRAAGSNRAVTHINVEIDVDRSTCSARDLQRLRHDIVH